ncbi:GAF domain-containing protein [Alkalinema pantanalense CENA528]|uniref:sensor histidine kinase n=1 Tax=Alkalinema pantanalense TaxID=1620705 RepID=UPI003D6F4A44
MGPVKEPNLYEQQLVTLGQVLQTLREADDSDFLIETTLSYLRSTFSPEYDLIWIGLYDRADHRMVGKGGHIIVHQNADFLRQRFTLTAGDLLEQVVFQQSPIALADLQQEMRAGEWRRIAQKHNIQGTMIFPICHRDRCFGVVILGSQRWGTFPTTEEKTCLMMVVGELATTLHRAELEWQRQQIKRPDRSLLALLHQMRSLSNLGQRLEAVIEETHRFVLPNRTNVYWFEPNQRYFWRRLSNHARTTGFLDINNPAPGITAQEIGSFYQSLLNDQVVAIGEAHSSLRADATARLMQLIRARSLLAAPILYQRQLLGFLAVEGNEPRIWQEEEKQFLRGAAQMLAMAAPLEEMETVIQQTQLDHTLTSEIAQSLYSAHDWKSTISRAASLLGKRLKAERFIVALYDKTHQRFELCYQNQPKNRRACSMFLPALSDIDRQLLERTPKAIGIENLEDDLRFAAWRNQLLEVGVRSLVVSPTAAGQAQSGLLIICHEMPRSWTQAEQDLVGGVAQQIGLILHQWQLQKRLDQQQQLSNSIQRSMTGMRQSLTIEALEQSALRSIASVLDAPLAFLVSWFPGRRVGRLVVSTDSSDRRYALGSNLKVSVHADPLLRMALEHAGVMVLRASQVPGESRQWLNTQGMGQLLAICLRTNAEDEPAGVLFVADGDQRQWDDRYLSALELLAGELAGTRRHLKLERTLQSERLKLEQIGWYKHRHLEEIYRSTHAGVQKLLDLAKPGADSLMATRQQQILRQMQDTLSPLATTLAEEQWQLKFRQETLPLIGLVRRTMDRADAILKERQLWSQVHHEDNPVVVGDAAKLEMVLYELLLSACLRSQAGGRIDIWCRQFDRRWIEVAITDDGTIESRLLQDLEGNSLLDPLAPSTLSQPPGLHLAVCREFITAMQGDFSLSRLEDGRIMSRLMLPSGQGNR